MRYHVARDSDAELVYRAEAELERVLPTKTLTTHEALVWVAQIAHDEDTDPPRIISAPLRGRTVAFACKDNQTIVFGTRKVTELTVLHEFAHLTTSGGHGAQFQRELIRLARKYLSLQHSQTLSINMSHGSRPL